MSEEFVGNVEPVESVAQIPPAEAGPGSVSGEVTPEGEAFTDLNALSPEEQESPRIKKALSDYFAKTREAAPWRKLSERLGGKTPEEIEATFRNYEQGQQIAEALQKLAGENKPPEEDPLASLASYGDEVTGPIRRVLEIANRADQRATALEQQQKERDRATVIDKAQSACGEFVKANPELNITAQQLFDACVKGGHHPFKQLPQAAIDAVGGLDKFLTIKNKKFLEDYQKQALENRKKSGTVVSPTAPVGTGMEQPDNFDDHYEVMKERFRANRAAREAMGG